MSEAKGVINNLQLEPHPEGGYFKEIYRSNELTQQEALPSRYDGERSFCTSIYYLLEGNDFSSFHRIQSDEIWHFYSGSPLSLYLLTKQHGLRQILLGNDFRAGQKPQFVVPKNTWFAAQCSNISNYSLMGCTVAPGFDFADFEMGKRKTLIEIFPLNEKEIVKFTRN